MTKACKVHVHKIADAPHCLSMIYTHVVSIANPSESAFYRPLKSNFVEAEIGPRISEIPVNTATMKDLWLNDP